MYLLIYCLGDVTSTLPYHTWNFEDRYCELQLFSIQYFLGRNEAIGNSVAHRKMTRDRSLKAIGTSFVYIDLSIRWISYLRMDPD